MFEIVPDCEYGTTSRNNPRVLGGKYFVQNDGESSAWLRFGHVAANGVGCAEP